MSNLAVELLAKAAAEDVKKTKLDLIVLVLNELLGEGKYAIEDIKERGKFIEKKGSEEQTFHFDGRDIIWFGKPKIDIYHDPGMGMSYTIDMPHKVLIVDDNLTDEVTH